MIKTYHTPVEIFMTPVKETEMALNVVRLSILDSRGLLM
jgi:hypothetical protein